MPSMPQMPDFSFENRLWKSGISVIGGVDEVGRGCLAGPVLAGCVVFKNLELIPDIKINDSKKLKPRERELASDWIKENCLSYGVGLATVSEINNFGIVKATEKAFRRAITHCELKIEYLLIDAFYVPYVKGLSKLKQKPIIKGDNISISIAAASIIAKVERDKLMLHLSKNYKDYGWERNKGYGTKEHQKAIKDFGLTKHHRIQFTRSFV